jgi:hypothetical protein
MKKRNLIAAASLAVCSVFAAHESSAQQELIRLLKTANYPTAKLEQVQFPFKTHNTAAKPTDIKQRVIAMAYQVASSAGEFVRNQDSIRYYRPPHTADNVKFPELFFTQPLNLLPQPPDPIASQIDLTDSIHLMGAVNGAYTNFLQRQISTELNANGQILTLLTFQHNPATLAWDSFARTTYQYNADKKMTSYVTESFPANAWVPELKYEYEYDVNQHLISQTRFIWQTATNVWKTGVKDSYTYDAAGNWTSRLSQNWDGTSWNDFWKYTYTYNADNNRTEEYQEYWLNNVHNPITHIFYQYNNNGLLTSDSVKGWDTMLSLWLDARHHIYTYDLNENHISTEDYLMMANTPTGVKYQKFIFTYNGDQISSMVTQDWDGSWKNTYRLQLAFDANNNPTSATESTWNTTSNTFESVHWDNKYLLYYEDYNDLGVAEQAKNKIDFDIFPNPSKDKFQVRSDNEKIQQLRITDLQGKTVYQNQSAINSNMVTISTAALPEGTYILQISTGKQTGSKTIVVHR